MLTYSRSTVRLPILRERAFAGILAILRGRADRRKRIDLAILADLVQPLTTTCACRTRARSDRDVLADDAVRPDLGVRADLGVRMDDRCRVKHHVRASTRRVDAEHARVRTTIENISSAEHANWPSTVASRDTQPMLRLWRNMHDFHIEPVAGNRPAAGTSLCRCRPDTASCARTRRARARPRRRAAPSLRSCRRRAKPDFPESGR